MRIPSWSKWPALVITPEANPAIAALNVLLGAVGAPGGIVVKNKTAPSHIPLEANSESYRALVIDSTVPWDFVPHNKRGGISIRRVGWRGEAGDWLLPAPGFLEELTDVPTAPTSGTETYSIGMNLLTQPTETKSAAQLLGKIDSTLPDMEKLIHARCEQLYQAKLGTIYADQPIAVREIRVRSKIGRAIA